MVQGVVFTHLPIEPALLERLHEKQSFLALDGKDQALLHLHIRTAQTVAKLEDRVKPVDLCIVKGDRNAGMKMEPSNVPGTFCRLIFNFGETENYILRSDRETTVYTLSPGDFLLLWEKDVYVSILRHPRREIRLPNGNTKWSIRSRNYTRHSLVVDFTLSPLSKDNVDNGTNTDNEQGHQQSDGRSEVDPGSSSL